MAKIFSSVLTAALLAACIGCVPGAPGKSGDDGPSPALPATLEVSPQLARVGVGETLQLEATVLQPGVGSVPASVTWVCPDSGVASVTTSGVVTGLSPGQVTVTAHGGAGSGLRADLEVVVLSGDLIFGLDENEGLVSFAIEGGDRTILPLPSWVNTVQFMGFAPFGNGIYLLLEGNADGNGYLWRYDIATGQLAQVPGFPVIGALHQLAVDGQGRLYTAGFIGESLWNIYRFDPAHPEQGAPVFAQVEMLGPNGLTVSPDGYLYVLNGLPATGAAFVARINLVTGQVKKVVGSSAGEGGFAVGVGIAVGDYGAPIHVLDGVSRRVYLGQDLDGDGSYLSPGEFIPCTSPLDYPWGMVRVGDDLIVNDKYWIESHLIRFRDIDGDGLFLSGGDEMMPEWSAPGALNSNTGCGLATWFRP